MPEIILGKYRHYKGDLYQVLGTCKHTETSEDLVYYKALYGTHQIWVRPLKIFFENIQFQGIWQPRFMFIENI